MHELVNRLKSDYPSIVFSETNEFKWDPMSKTISYTNNGDNPTWSMMHELGHMELGHKKYISDFSLLKMEAAAWHKAKFVSLRYNIEIDSEHIEKCLDSYRDWLYRRSKCRRCMQAGLEKTTNYYSCLNCGFAWKVSPKRFCRVYRKEIKT